jgi:hypothetical protein
MQLANLTLTDGKEIAINPMLVLSVLPDKKTGGATIVTAFQTWTTKEDFDSVAALISNALRNN